MARTLSPVLPDVSLEALREWAGITDAPDGFTEAVAKHALRRYARASVRKPVIWGVPTRGHPSARWVQAMWRMYKHPDDVIWFIEGTLVDAQRNALVEEFLKTDVEWLMQWDDDVAVLEQDSDVVARLIRVAEEYDAGIVSGLYHQKRKPYIPHLYSDVTEDPEQEARLYTPITDFAMGSTVEVAGAGGGFLLVHRRVYEAMAEGCDRKWFTFRYGFGEDLAFCHQARQMGHKIYVDTSIKLAHLTTEGINTNHYIAHQLRLEAGDEDVKQAVEEQKARMAQRASGSPYGREVLDELYEQGCALYKDWAGLTEATLQARLAAGTQHVERVWRIQQPRTPEEVDEFYREIDYIPDLLEFNRSQTFANKILKPLRFNAMRVADFGGGIGTLSILFARQGRAVWHIDVPGQTREFAQTRFATLDMVGEGKGTVTVTDSLPGDLELITAIDVLEHIHPDRIDETARQIAGALAPGGKFYHRSSFLPVGETNVTHPMHYSTEPEWERALVKYGLTKHGSDLWSKGEVN